MYPFIWLKGGGSQESVMVVEFMEMMEKLLGGAVGTEGKTIVQYAVNSTRETLYMKSCLFHLVSSTLIACMCVTLQPLSIFKLRKSNPGPSDY